MEGGKKGGREWEGGREEGGREKGEVRKDKEGGREGHGIKGGMWYPAYNGTTSGHFFGFISH